MLAVGFAADRVAAEVVERLETTHRDGQYTVEFVVVLEAAHDHIWTLMTDYEKLPRLTQAIRDSRVLDRRNDQHARVALDVRGCVLFFCKSFRQVADIHIRPKQEIEVITEPTQSDLRRAHEHWRLASVSEKRTRLSYTAEWEPAFFVPPIIGPVMIRYFLEREIQMTAQRVEDLATHE